MGVEEVEANVLQKLARPLIDVSLTLIPIIISICQSGYKFYKKLPLPYVYLIIGTVMCFFGGIYPTVFAALQVCIYGVYCCIYVIHICHDVKGYHSYLLFIEYVHYSPISLLYYSTFILLGCRTRWTYHSAKVTVVSK